MGFPRYPKGSYHRNFNEFLEMIEATATDPIPFIEVDEKEKELENYIYSAMKSDEIATKFFHKLQELHLTKFEKNLDLAPSEPLCNYKEPTNIPTSLLP